MEEVLDSGLLAHELKAPLATIRQLGLLSGDEAVVYESEKALQLVENLTLLARLGQTELPLEPLNPRALAEEVTASLSPQFSAAGRALQLDLSGRADLIWGERRLVQSIIENLARNALRYADPAAASRLFIKCRGERVLIGARDYGPRLPTHIFRAINQGVVPPQAISRRPGSSGLGLYISSHFARAMGAKLGARQHLDGVSVWLDIARSRQGSWL